MKTSFHSWRSRLGGGVLLAAIALALAYAALRGVEAMLAPPAPRVGQAAPNFRAHDLEGRELSLDALRGQVVVLDFFATWCSGCVAFWPAAERIAADHGASGLAWIGVHLAPAEPRVVSAFLAERQSKIRVVIDPGDMARTYGIFATPSYVVLDRGGRVRGVFLTMASEPQLRKLIEVLLAEPVASASSRARRACIKGQGWA